jgi:hypothetical protein
VEAGLVVPKSQLAEQCLVAVFAVKNYFFFYFLDCSAGPSLLSLISVADLGCISRMLIFNQFLYPGSWNPDLGSNNNNKKEGTLESGIRYQDSGSN